MGVVVVADAQSAQISSFRLEHGVSQNNQSGVLVRFKLNVNGYRGKTMSAVAYIDSPKGVGVKDTNGKYCTTSGTVAFFVDFTPRYENSAYDNFQIFMPYNEMHLPVGTREYFCRVFIFEKHKGWITHSDYASFTGTTSASQTPQSSRQKYSHLLPSAGTLPNENQFVYYTNNSGGLASVRIYYGKDVKEYCAYLYFKSGNQARGEIRYFTKQYFDSSGNYWAFKEYMQWLTYRQGKSSTLYIAEDWTYVKIENTIFDIPISKERFDQLVPKVSGGGGGGHNGGYNSGGNGGGGYQSGPSHIDKPCGYCGGGGGCRSCNGRGYKYNHYSGHDERCSSRNGSGRCFNCRGTGKQATF